MRRQLYHCTSEERAKVLNTLREALEAQHDVRFAYVYGSFLEDRPFHDIDVAVYVEVHRDKEVAQFALNAECFSILGDEQILSPDLS